MKRLPALAALAAVAAACAHAPQRTAQARPAPSVVALPALPTGAKPLFENGKVRVSEIRLGPGRSMPLPLTPDQLIYSREACRLRLDSLDGRSWDVKADPDQVIWSDPAQREAQAVGSAPCDLVIIELKPGLAGPPAPPPRAPTTGSVQTSAP